MLKNLVQKSKILPKNSSIIFFILLLTILVGCSSENPAKQEAEQLNYEYSINISDYRYGLKFFDEFARELPLNQPELETVLSKYDALIEKYPDEPYLLFMRNLIEAEKLYKSGERRPFAGYNGIVRCSRKEEIRVSLQEVETAVNLTKNAIDIYHNNKEEINVDSSWITGVEQSNRQIERIIRDKTTIINDHCNSSQSE